MSENSTDSGPPPTQGELERRGLDSLSERQRGNFERWGYPYIFDEFRFHMTLSCRLDTPERDSFRAKLKPLADVSADTAVDIDAVLPL